MLVSGQWSLTGETPTRQDLRRTNTAAPPSRIHLCGGKIPKRHSPGPGFPS